MRRLLVVMALMLTGSAAMTVAGEGPLAPEGETAPSAAEAVLSTVRSVLSPVAPVEPGPVPDPARVPEAVSPEPPLPGLADMVPAPEVPGGEPAAAPAPPSRTAPAPQRESAAADDARCEPLNVTLSAGPRSVAPGEESTLLVAIGNPGNRPLSRLSLALDLSGTDGVQFAVSSTNPPADSVSGGKVVFDDLGGLGVGATRQVQVVVKMDRASRAGRMTSTAVATGDCERSAAGTQAVSGRGVLAGPDVTGRAPAAAASPTPAPAEGAGSRSAAAGPAQAAAGNPGPAGGGLLSRTGGLVGLALACWLTAAGVGLQTAARAPRRFGRVAGRRRPTGRPVRWMCGERP